jgi:FkbH-like protein
MNSFVNSEPSGAKARPVKCVVWDLDNTVWSGTLLENDNLEIRAGIPEIIDGLDARGVVNSIASHNEFEEAFGRLREFGLDQFFVYPEINWNVKSSALKSISSRLNIGLDSIVLVDDDSFQRGEVAAALPMVRCVDAADVGSLLQTLGLLEVPVTVEGRARRRMYQAEMAREVAEEKFQGPNQAFMASLGMIVTISRASSDDLTRVEELTIRTSQLNSTGLVYSREELEALRCSERHRLLVISLDDKFGTYGRIGLALIELGEEIWTLKLLVMSCRVMSRGIGGLVLQYLLREAKNAGVKFLADFVRTERNRIMLITYKFAGFKEVDRGLGVRVLEHDLENVAAFPAHIEMRRELSAFWRLNGEGS